MTHTATTASHSSNVALWASRDIDIDLAVAIATDVDYLLSLEDLTPPMDEAYAEYLDAVDDYIDRMVDVL